MGSLPAVTAGAKSSATERSADVTSGRLSWSSRASVAATAASTSWRGISPPSGARTAEACWRSAAARSRSHRACPSKPRRCNRAACESMASASRASERDSASRRARCAKDIGCATGGCAATSAGCCCAIPRPAEVRVLTEAAAGDAPREIATRCAKDIGCCCGTSSRPESEPSDSEAAAYGTRAVHVLPGLKSSDSDCSSGKSVAAAPAGALKADLDEEACEAPARLGAALPAPAGRLLPLNEERLDGVAAGALPARAANLSSAFPASRKGAGERCCCLDFTFLPALILRLRLRWGAASVEEEGAPAPASPPLASQLLPSSGE